MDKAFTLEKPVNLREDVWQFLLAKLEAIPKQDLAASLEAMGYVVHDRDPSEKLVDEVAHDPSRFLEHNGMLSHPELLEGLVIELDNKIDYLIDASAAHAIVRGDALIQLSRLGDTNQKYAIARDHIVRAMQEGTGIDYIEGRRSPGPTEHRR